MLDFLFGWRKASKCKELIKRTQCRLKLLQSKKITVIQVLKEDIARLLKNGHEQIALNKLEQLYVDENIMSMYEMLNTFSEFILLNMSYIRRHKDVPNDVNEAISTVLFASARIGEIPELRLIRKLFMERYGKRFVAAAVELYPGNFVNSVVKDKLNPRSVPEDVKNRMVDEIVRNYLCKLGPLAIEYKPDIQEQLQKVAETSKVRSSLSMLNTPTRSKLGNFPQLSPPYEHKFKSHSSENSIYLDDIEEFKSRNKQRRNSDDQDQRFFVFRIETQAPKHYEKHHQIVPIHHDTNNIDDEKQARKRTRRKMSASKENPTINDALRDIYYSSSPGNRRKYQKKIHGHINKKLQVINCLCEFQCKLDEPCYFYATNSSQGGFRPYERSTTMPQRYEMGKSKDIRRMSSLPVENGYGECSGGIRNSSSPRHVHPKLPDYDEIAAKFRALKKAHLKSKGTP
ncbi:hypothetical protein RND81_11G100300 [Saponaria officinalis]|uniref:Uncharacterized protein n=1 Tax=Saponaria officinalis TaxID=3572 RepID=A0AAW1HK30_SAPOF